MAELTGPLQFKGKLGNIIGRQVNGKNIISLPGGFTSKKLKDTSYKKYDRCRENSNEFKYASQMSLAIFRSLKAKTSPFHFQSHANGKLTGKLLRLRTFDLSSPRGERKPSVGALSMLKHHRLSAPKLNPWLSEPDLQRLNETSLKIKISKPSAALNQKQAEHSQMEVRLITQHIDIQNRKVLDTKTYHQEIDLLSDQPIEWMAELFSENTLVSISTHFHFENNGFKLPLTDKSICSLFIADFFI